MDTGYAGSTAGKGAAYHSLRSTYRLRVIKEGSRSEGWRTLRTSIGGRRGCHYDACHTPHVIYGAHWTFGVT